MCIAYDIFQQKRKKKTWENMFNVYFITRNLILVISGIVILYFRLKVMNFEGPIFTSIDNPASFSESIFVKVNIFKLALNVKKIVLNSITKYF